MPHYEAKMTSKGQITVPAAVREFFQLQAGDIVDFYLDEVAGEVRVRARNRAASELFGSLNAHANPDGRPATIEAMNEAVGRHLAEDDARIQREWRERRKVQAQKKSKVSQAAK